MKVITETYLMKVITETYLMKVITETYLMKVITETYLMKVNQKPPCALQVKVYYTCHKMHEISD
jgi:hypothetical protein